MPNSPDPASFAAYYAGKAPWDIGKPQPALVAAAGRMSGSILDAGCGTGDSTLFLAGLGHRVTGIDFLEEAVIRAKHKALEMGVTATFLVKDALTLMDWGERFDNVVDCGLFHLLSDEDRSRYVRGLAAVLKPDGRLFLLCFSDEQLRIPRPRTAGTRDVDAAAAPPSAAPEYRWPRWVTKEELRAAFDGPWCVEAIDPAHFEVRDDIEDNTFSEGGPKAWFATVRRTRA